MTNNGVDWNLLRESEWKIRLTGEFISSVKPLLTITRKGWGRKEAEDEFGNGFITFVVDPLIAEDEALQPCDICDEPVAEGWCNLDGGEVYHYDCVVVTKETK